MWDDQVAIHELAAAHARQPFSFPLLEELTSGHAWLAWTDEKTNANSDELSGIVLSLKVLRHIYCTSTRLVLLVMGIDACFQILSSLPRIRTLFITFHSHSLTIYGIAGCLLAACFRVFRALSSPVEGLCHWASSNNSRTSPYSARRTSGPLCLTSAGAALWTSEPQDDVFLAARNVSKKAIAKQGRTLRMPVTY